MTPASEAIRGGGLSARAQHVLVDLAAASLASGRADPPLARAREIDGLERRGLVVDGEMTIAGWATVRGLLDEADPLPWWWLKVRDDLDHADAPFCAASVRPRARERLAHMMLTGAGDVDSLCASLLWTVAEVAIDPRRDFRLETWQGDDVVGALIRDDRARIFDVVADLVELVRRAREGRAFVVAAVGEGES